MKQYASYQTIANSLKLFFPDYPATTKATVEEIYAAFGRSHLNEAINTNWLGSKLTPLRHYGLVESVYSTRNGKRVRTGIRLNQAGRKAIEAPSLDDLHGQLPPPVPSSAPATLKPVAQASFSTLAAVIAAATQIKKSAPEISRISFKDGRVEIEVAVE